MSAVPGSRTSVQSYSSNLEAGDSFQLYERRFGNVCEASQIYDILKLKIALLPGGKDSKNGPIIIFPSDSGVHKVSEYDVINCLIYLGSIPSEASVKNRFSVIIDDQRGTLSGELNFILSCCQTALGNAISDVYIVEEYSSTNLGLNRDISSANLHLVTKANLRNDFDLRHLPTSLGGRMSYNHEMWLTMRIFVESYAKEAFFVCSELDAFILHMRSNLFHSTPTSLHNLWNDYLNVRQKAERCIRKGEDYRVRNNSSIFESHEENELMVMQRTNSAMRSVEGRLSTLDSMWRQKEVDEQQKAGILFLEKEMNEVVEWILGPGDKLLMSQRGIGRDYASADELRKQHERLELKCLDSYGKYAELRHKAEAYVRFSNAEEAKATELEAQRDYMDTVHRGFAKRLEQRRNVVVAAVKFHRLLDEIFILLEEIRKQLDGNIDMDRVESQLDLLNELSDKLDFNRTMALKEGSLLKDMLCLPTKDARGRDAGVDSGPDVAHVEACLERIRRGTEGVAEALDLRKLELQQSLQLKICEQNVEQAIAWIEELDGLVNDQDTLRDHSKTLKDLERYQEELSKGENTAKNSYDYGQQLLKASVYLRRVLGLDLEPNVDQANRLNEAWRGFSRGSSENAARRAALAIFDKKSEEFLLDAENLLANLDKSSSLQSTGERLKELNSQKRNLDQHHRELQLAADGLRERIQKPVLYDPSDSNQFGSDNLQVAENIKIKIQRMNDRMNQLERKFSSISKNGYAPGYAPEYTPGMKAVETSDSFGNSYVGQNETQSRGAWKEINDGERVDRKAIETIPNQLNEWLENNALRRITDTNSLGSTLQAVEEFYDKHVECLQAMKSQEQLYRGKTSRNFPQQWNVVQEIIKQRITIALSLIKFHLSLDKASENLMSVERLMVEGRNADIPETLRKLEADEEKMLRNAADFMNCASNQVYNDEYLNVDEPKNFVRDILDKWKQRKAQVEGSLLNSNMGKLLEEADQIKEELMNLENEIRRSSSSLRGNNMSAWMDRMEGMYARISTLEDDFVRELNASAVEPSHASEVESRLENLKVKFSDVHEMLEGDQRAELQGGRGGVGRGGVDLVAGVEGGTRRDGESGAVRVPGSDEISILKPLENVTARKGESLKLTCHIDASPVQRIQLRWLKDGSPLICDGGKFSSRYQGGRCELTIDDVNSEDSGRYSCLAVEGRCAISTAEVSIEAAPTIKEPLRDRTVREGEPVEFSIRVVGKPVPAVQWFQNGKEISSSSPDFQISSSSSSSADGVHTLRISEVFDEDKGLYTVVARNKHGEISDRARLHVSVAQPGSEPASKSSRSSNWTSQSTRNQSNTQSQASYKDPAPSESKVLHAGFLKPLADKSSEAGEDIILECNLPSFPAPTKTTWHKDGVEITRNIPSIRTSSSHQGVCRLVVERADASHSGRYVCRAHYADRICETSMYLTVRDKSSATKLPPSTTPDPKYSSTFALNPRRSETSSSNNATSFQVAPFESSLKSLEVPWKAADEGGGSSLRNSVPPQFVKKMESKPLVEGSSVTFSCKVIGEPAPNIQWYHNGRLIRPSGKYPMRLTKDGECLLTVTDCGKQDAGHYTCCALNVTGRDVCSGELVSEGTNDVDTTSYMEPEALRRILMPKASSKAEEVHSGVVEVLSEPSFAKSCVTEVTFDEGETARIECKVYGNPAPDIAWYKNGREISRGGRHQILLNQEGVHSLVVKGVRPSDAGVYTCRAHSKSGQATRDFTLNVEDASSKYQSKIFLSRGGSGTRTPEVAPVQSPTPQSPNTYTSSVKMFSDSTKMKMSSKQAELQKAVDSETNSHVVSVRSTLTPKEQQQQQQQQQDHFPPRFLITPDPVTAEEGGHAKFWAKVSADPPATVAWFIDGREVFSSSRFNVHFDGLMHLFEISKVKKFDAGEVKVEARNSKGAVQHAVRLVVADPVDLRSRLHPTTALQQNKKHSLPSLDNVSTKGDSYSIRDKKDIHSYEGRRQDDKEGQNGTNAEAMKVGDDVDSSNRPRFGTSSESKESIEAAARIGGDDREAFSLEIRDGMSRLKSTPKDSLPAKVNFQAKVSTGDLDPRKDSNVSSGFVDNDSSDRTLASDAKTRTPEFIGSRNEVDQVFDEKSIKSTERKWKQSRDGRDDESAPVYGGISSSSFRSEETAESFHKKDAVDRKPSEESMEVMKRRAELDRRCQDLLYKDAGGAGRNSEGESKRADSGRLKDTTGIRHELDLKDVDSKGKSSSGKSHVEEAQTQANGGGGGGGNRVKSAENKHSSGENLTIKEEPITRADDKEESSISTSEEERAREQKYISTMTEEITYKDVNNVPQKFSTRLLKTVEYTKTDSFKSSTLDKQEEEGEDREGGDQTHRGAPYTRQAMSEFQWDIKDEENRSSNSLQDIGHHYKKWREEASAEMTSNDRRVEPNRRQNGRSETAAEGAELGGRYTTDRATGDHLEISNKSVQYDSSGRLSSKESVRGTPAEKSTTVQDIETTDEITVETKVTQVKTVSMQLSEAGDINLTETTQVQTDTDMKETKRTREREELVVSHAVDVIDGGTATASVCDSREEVSAAESSSERYDLFSTWNVEPGVLVALHSYEPDSDEVMSLHEGEKLEFLEENSEDWWFVRKFFDNRQGFVPSRLLQTKEEFDKNISDKIAQQIDKIDDAPTIKLEDSSQEMAPQMTNLLTDVTVHDGTPASFECHVTGDPRPAIAWFHNSKIIKPSPDFLQFYDPNFICSLSIREVFPEDGGRYTMVAKNCFGVASSSAELTVVENELMRDKQESKDSESPLLVAQPKHAVLDEGQTAKFTCKFRGKPPMKVSWFKDGRKISPSDKVKLDIVDEEEGSLVTVELTLDDVAEGQTGRYRVLASNEAGEAEAFTSLVVKAALKSVDFKASLKKTSREINPNVTFRQERVKEETGRQERLHSHTEETSSFGRSEVIQHDFRDVLKPPAAKSSSSSLHD